MIRRTFLGCLAALPVLKLTPRPELEKMLLVTHPATPGITIHLSSYAGGFLKAHVTYPGHERVPIDWIRQYQPGYYAMSHNLYCRLPEEAEFGCYGAVKVKDGEITAKGAYGVRGGDDRVFWVNFHATTRQTPPTKGTAFCVGQARMIPAAPGSFRDLTCRL